VSGAESSWSAVEALFHAMLAVPADQRADVLARACSDPAMRAEVQSLLDAHAGRGAIDELADEVMSPLFAPRPVGRDPREALATQERYRILERLGGGGMGVVYRARDERLARDVALKFLPSHLSADLAAKQRFLVEARAAAALEHPNICTVHEIGDTDDGQLYIIMACYDGEALDKRIARGPLPVSDALRIASDVLRGLSKAHERGIIHRDIKPANVMITADGLVKILDFGIAKLSGSGTQTVGAIGTVAYMSPEQAFGEAVDHRTDYWSLGVMLYEMLTGTRPFTGSEHAMLMAVLTGEPEPISRLRADVPPGVETLVRTLLAKRPEGRYPDAPTLLRAIAEAPSVAAAVAPPLALPDSALTASGERRQITVVQAVLLGVDRLYEQQAPERVDQVMTNLRDLATAVATHHGGLVNHFSSDGFVMLFGVPTAHEDDPVRAVRAAMAMQARLASASGGGALQVAIGVHTGAVVAQRLREGDRRFRITGAAVDLAGRLSAAAGAGAVLMSNETRRLVGPFALVEPAASVTVSGGLTVVPFRVTGLSDAGARFDLGGAVTPFVGRDREREQLLMPLAAIRGGQGAVCLVVGEAGAGKSRLVHEVRQQALSEDIPVLVGRCDAYGGTTAFLPFIEASLSALGVDRSTPAPDRHDAVVDAVRRLAAPLEEYLPLYLALLATPSRTYPVPEHLRDESLQVAMRDALAALLMTVAARTPTVLLLEDWHWADDASRMAVRQLAEMIGSVSLLMLITTRPDGATGLDASEQLAIIHLSPLDAASSSGIARAVFGADTVADDLVASLHERTGGNPFFLEEVCEALLEEGVVQVRNGRAEAVGAIGGPRIPDTVQGVLRTRIDRLDPVARDVLRVAAVIGREFTRGILDSVVSSTERAELPRAIDRLKASGLVQQAALLPEPVYRFKHALTQEVAYDSLLEHQRRTLHEAVGRAIEVRHASRLDEQVARLAHHFSRAECWGEAVRYSIASADRAAALSQTVEALATLDRAEEWLARLPDSPERLRTEAEVALRQERLCEVMGLRTRQLGIVAALIDRLVPHGPSAELAQAYLRQGDAYTLLKRFDEAEEALTNSRRVAVLQRDDAAERSALRSLALLRSHQMRYEEAVSQIEQVMAMAREAGEARAEPGDLASLANMLRAMGQRERALEVLESALEQSERYATGEDGRVIRYGALLNVMGTIHRELGNFDQADAYYRRTRSRLPDHAYASFSLPMIAQMQLERGEVEAALATYEEAHAMTRRARYADGTAHLSRSLGDLLVGLERIDQAMPYLREAATLFHQLEDGANELEARASLARALRRRDPSAPEARLEFEVALRLAEQIGDGPRRLTLHNTLGIMAWERRDLDASVSHFSAGLRLCEEMQDTVHEGLMLNSLAAVRLQQQSYAEASSLLQRSLAVTEARQEHQLHLHALITMARVQAAQGEIISAQASLARAEPYVELLADDSAQATVARLRAELEARSHPS
jgi:predicted ATPase/class 3 adenylate cyclase